MNIDCYYEFPGTSIWCTSHYFEEFYQSIKNRYTEHTVTNINCVDLPEYRSSEPCMKYSQPHMIIQNRDTKKYFIVSYWDKMDFVSEYSGWDLENCVEIIVSSGTHKEDVFYEPIIDRKFTPFSYIPAVKDSLKKIKEIRNNDKRKTPKKPMFMGFLYEFREYLSKDKNFDVRGHSFEHMEYIEYLNNYTINMSLNGAGQICYRDIEILGLGTALFRPKLTTNFHNPLIPDYHYIAVDYDSIKGVQPKDKFYSLLRDLMLQKWNEVINDKVYINTIANNGREWFDNNATMESQSKILLDILDIKKLL